MTGPATYDEWAGVYDLTDRDLAPEIGFYRSLVGPDTSALLDLGCGTGTITSAVGDRIRELGRAQAAPRIVGVDHSEAMLRVARERDPEIEWRLGDVRRPPVAGPFDLAMSCFNTLQMLTGDGDLPRVFAAVRAVLAPGGRFVFDVYRPNEAYLAASYRDRLTRTVTDPDGRRLELREDSAYDRARRLLVLDWRLVAPDDGAQRATARFEMRQYFPDELERLLDAAGLEILERYGDIDRSPFGPGSRKQVLACGVSASR